MPRNSRIPWHRDPTVKPWDDTRTLSDDSYLGNSRIPRFWHKNAKIALNELSKSIER
nr:hypothetical protein [uncultured Campylobacter sp.]